MRSRLAPRASPGLVEPADVFKKENLPVLFHHCAGVYDENGNRACQVHLLFFLPKRVNASLVSLNVQSAHMASPVGRGGNSEAFEKSK